MPYLFANDNTHYSQWETIHLHDMVTLQEKIQASMMNSLMETLYYIKKNSENKKKKLFQLLAKNIRSVEKIAYATLENSTVCNKIHRKQFFATMKRLIQKYLLTLNMQLKMT